MGGAGAAEPAEREAILTDIKRVRRASDVDPKDEVLRQ